MKTLVSILMFCAALLCPGSVLASQSTQQLAVCLTDALDGMERKQLAKWIYFGMSSHSMIKPFSKITEKDIDESDRYVGLLITKLMTEDCPTQAKTAFTESGSRAFELAFGLVGEVAMQELMNEPGVVESLGAFEKHLAKEKLDATFK
jgi:hypothetical protein